MVLTLLGRKGEISGLKAGHIQTYDLKELEQTKKELENIHVLVSTPMKFCKLAKIGYDMTQFNQVVFDEADKYFEMSFMSQFSNILDSLKKNKNTNYYLFSATFPVEIENQLKDVFIDPIEIIIRGKMTVLDTIDQKLIFTGSEFGKLLEIKNIINVSVSWLRLNLTANREEKWTFLA